jgi:hypothetical protein
MLHGAGYLKSWLSLTLSKKFPASLWNPKVHYHAHKSPPLDAYPEPAKSSSPHRPYLPKAHLNVILSPTLRSSQWSLPFRSPNQNPVNTSPLPNACHIVGSLVTTAWRVLRFRMEGRPPDTEGSCEYTERAVADSRQGVALRFCGWAWG